MIFTNTDKALMMRAARHLAEQAKALKASHGQNWALDKATKEAKRSFDRLLRDERDLRELAKRLEKAAAAAVAEREARKLAGLSGGFGLDTFLQHADDRVDPADPMTSGITLESRQNGAG